MDKIKTDIPKYGRVESECLFAMKRIAALMRGWEAFRNDYIKYIHAKDNAKIVKQLDAAFADAVEKETEYLKSKSETCQ